MAFCLLHLITEYQHTPTVWNLWLSNHDNHVKTLKGNCWFLQRERLLQMAVLCSRRRWYKVEPNWHGRFLTLLTRLLDLCVACCIMWKTCQRPPTDWCAGPSCSVGEHWAVWFLCFYLLNVCVSPGLFCLMFSDVITGSRLYSVRSCSPWLPPSGGNVMCSKITASKTNSQYIINIRDTEVRLAVYSLFILFPVMQIEKRPGFIGVCASVFSFFYSCFSLTDHLYRSPAATNIHVTLPHSVLFMFSTHEYRGCSSTGFSSFLLYKGWAISR